jgi:hypothetical protein
MHKSKLGGFIIECQTGDWAAAAAKSVVAYMSQNDDGLDIVQQQFSIVP